MEKPQVDRDYLGVEEIIKENLYAEKVAEEEALRRGEKVRFTTETPGWREVIEPYLGSKTALKAVDPSKEGWERQYLASWAIVTVATELLGMIRSWISQADEIKEKKKK